MKNDKIFLHCHSEHRSAVMLNLIQHPSSFFDSEEKWILNQVQDDDCGRKAND